MAWISYSTVHWRWSRILLCKDDTKDAWDQGVHVLRTIGIIQRDQQSTAKQYGKWHWWRPKVMRQNYVIVAAVFCFSSFLSRCFLYLFLTFYPSADGRLVICVVFLSALVIWYRFIIPCIGSFFIFFFGNVPVLLRVYNPVSPYRSTRPQESRTTWSFMSMWRGWMGQGFSLDYTISLLVFVGFYSFICMRYYESMDE